jgi:hypothetical protein
MTSYEDGHVTVMGPGEGDDVIPKMVVSWWWEDDIMVKMVMLW